MEEKLKILILIKPFWVSFAKHKPKYDMIKAIEDYADVYYWYKDGNIHNIIKSLGVKPDFIFHYDIAWGNGLAPQITGLHSIDIPKGCFVIDLHWQEDQRVKYFEENKIDLIFSSSKNPFLNIFPQYEDKHRWFPWAINPNIIKDWKQEKDINFLLMGLVYYEDPKSPPKQQPKKGRYALREAVLKKMKNEKGFVFHPHPGHRVTYSEDALVNVKYAKELNRSKMFFTCGGEMGGFAVLKFFEAPGCKTLLMAEPNQEIYELGFIDGHNFVACDTSNFYRKALYYIENEAERIRITENGYKFIHKHHTIGVRAKQFVEYIKEYIDNI
ncbi:glycosyltransferase [Priestia megaterium]|uniref:glycosyltransferase n=1 Tax=Priestia megaterium TaxID=1404 RepID=UPI0005C763A6|nr:glycosyltransferase [Priestia megaterium]